VKGVHLENDAEHKRTCGSVVTHLASPDGTHVYLALAHSVDGLGVVRELVVVEHKPPGCVVVCVGGGVQTTEGARGSVSAHDTMARFVRFTQSKKK
jgi:hypothetical protein